MFEKKLTEEEKAIVKDIKRDICSYNHLAEVSKSSGIRVINRRKAEYLQSILNIINRLSR